MIYFIQFILIYILIYILYDKHCYFLIQNNPYKKYFVYLLMLKFKNVVKFKILMKLWIIGIQVQCPGVHC